jgi:hypothetical protein
MAGKKEKKFEFRCDEDFFNWLNAQIAMSDMRSSEFIRGALIYGSPLVNAFQGLKPSLENIREK